MIVLSVGAASGRTRTRTRTLAVVALSLVITALLTAGASAASAHPGDSDAPATPTVATVADFSGPVLLTDTASPSEAAAVDRLFAATRGVAYLAIAVLVGGMVFLVALWPDGAGRASARRLLWSAWGIVVVTSVAGIALAGLDRADYGLGHHLLDRTLIGDTLESRFGRAWAARLVLAVPAVPLLAALGLYRREAPRATWWVVPAAAVGVGLVRTPGFVSHASFSEPAWFGSIVDLVHVSALAVWIGGLVMVVASLLPSRSPGEIAAVLKRYSTVAFGAVAVAITTGAMLAWQLVGSWSSLTSTEYGRALLVKLAILGTLLAVAHGSRRLVNQRLRVALVPGSGAVRIRPFVVSVGAEVALASAVLVAAALLVNLPPPS